MITVVEQVLVGNAATLLTTPKGRHSCELTQEQRDWLHKHTRGVINNELVRSNFFKQFNREIGPSTVSKYKQLAVLPGHRGRLKLLDDHESALLLLAFKKVRETGTPVQASLCAGVARGIKEKREKGSTSLGGGPMKFSTSWAEDWMKENGIRVRHATTDRTISCEEIIRLSKGFFEELRAAKENGVTCKELVYNADEFFLSLSAGGGTTWTWERIECGEKRNIVVRQDKQGITCLVLTNARGRCCLLQFIYQGTERKFENSKLDTFFCKKPRVPLVRPANEESPS